MNRRSVLSGVGAALLGGLAGCAGLDSLRGNQLEVLDVTVGPGGSPTEAVVWVTIRNDGPIRAFFELGVTVTVDGNRYGRSRRVSVPPDGFTMTFDFDVDIAPSRYREGLRAEASVG